MLKHIFSTGIRHFQRNLNGNLINLLSLTIGFTISILVFTFLRYQLTFDAFHYNAKNIYRISKISNTSEGQVFSSQTPYPLHKALQSTAYIEEVTQTLGPWPQKIFIEEQKYMQEGVLFVDPAFTEIFKVEWINGNREVLNEPNTLVLTETVASKLYGSDNPIGKVIDLDGKVQAMVRGIVKDAPYNSSLTYEIIASKKLMESIQPYYLLDSWESYSPGKTWVLLGDNNNKTDLESQLERLISNHLGNDQALRTDYELTELINLQLDERFGSSKSLSRTTLYSVLFMGIFVLFTSVLNFANLHTAQTIRRLGEVGIKKILGSSRSFLIIQFALEALALVSIAGLLAIVLATNLFGYINSSLSILNLDLNLSQPALQFLIILILGVTTMTVVYPVRVVSSIDAVALLKSHKARSTKGKALFRSVLLAIQFVFAQIFITLVLIFFSQFAYMQRLDPGFETENIFMFDNFMPGFLLNQTQVSTAKEQLLLHPKITQASFGTGGPNAQAPWSVQIEDAMSGRKLEVDYKHVEIDYLELFGLQLLAGRWFTNSDYQSPTQKVVVSKNMLERLGVTDTESFIGRNLKVGGISTIVVGVLEDFHSADLRSEINPVLFEADFEGYGQGFFEYTTGGYQEVASHFEKISSELNANYIPKYSSFDDELTAEYEIDQVMFRFVVITTSLAILVCSLGLYSLVSFTLQQKTKEIGIRKAVGAGVNSLFLTISKRYLLLILLSALIASPFSYTLGNTWLQEFAYHQNFQFVFLLYATTLLLVISFLCIVRKSLKALHASPIKALRYE